MFDSSKLKELEDHKLISITWKDDWDEIVAYDFVFKEGQVFMQSSNNGIIFVCNYTDMRIDRMRNYKDIKSWYREFAIELVIYIAKSEDDNIDSFVFRELWANNTMLGVHLGIYNDYGDIVEWIAESKFLIDD